MSDCISPSDAALARRLIELTQAGLPVVAEPWQWLAAELGLTEADTLALLARLQQGGAIRRVAAVPNHYRLGYRYNGMTVWDVDDDQVDRLGAQIGREPGVSHCYRRPRRLPVWHYNLFAMIHGRSQQELDQQRAHLRQLLGAARRSDDMLVSSRILKKTGVRLPETLARTPSGTPGEPSQHSARQSTGQSALQPNPNPDTGSDQHA